MRQYFIAGNWKMNMLPSEAAEFALQLREALSTYTHKILVAPPFTALPAVAEALKGSNIFVAAQNVSHELSGAFTGEVSVNMLQDLSVHCAIIGHSERRIIFAETNEIINKKITTAMKHNCEVIFCIGETLSERESGMLESVIKEQIVQGLKGVSETDLSHITVAYEPVWAIGTGKTATPQDADSVHAFIRTVIAEQYSQDAAEKIIIQYGGSVKPENARELMSMQNIDGALVGGASLKVQSFVDILSFDRR